MFGRTGYLNLGNVRSQQGVGGHSDYGSHFAQKPDQASNSLAIHGMKRFYCHGVVP